MLRTFILRTLAFGLPVLLLLLGLELVQRHLPGDYQRKKARLEARAGEIETLILGSSHAYLGIAPEAWEGQAYNLAFTAQTLYFDWFLLEKYLDSLPQLQTVIIPVSYPSLGAESDRNPGEYNKSYHFAYFYGSTAFTKWYSPRRYSLVSLFTIKKAVDRTYAYYTGRDSLVEFLPSGWFPTEEQRDLERNARESGGFHDQYYDEALRPVNLDRLARMVAMCQERGVQPVLVSMPMWEGYARYTRPERFAYMTRATDSLAQSHGVPYFDFTWDPRFEDVDFFDSNHLRRQGALKFTHLLQDTLRAHAQALLAEE